MCLEDALYIALKSKSHVTANALPWESLPVVKEEERQDFVSIIKGDTKIILRDPLSLSDGLRKVGRGRVT